MSDRTALVSPVVRDHREIPVTSWTAFLATAAILPLWATSIVPISAVYQLGMAIVRAVNPKTQQSFISYDSGYVVDPSRVVSRSERKYDIVVLGVTGFCGRLAARHLARTYGVDGKSVKWAIAGRSKSKLEQVKKELADELGIPDLVHVDVITVDTAVPATLPALVEQTRVVATTVGPFTLYGNHVVEFCSKFGTHYVDITGEVDWVKSMHGLWHETARKSGAKIISFCGHDSIPWDLSMMKLQEAMTECNDELESVTFWDELIGEAPGGTFATILAVLDGAKPPPVAYDPFSRQANGKETQNTLKSRLPFFLSRSNSPWDVATNGSPSKRWQAPFLMSLVNLKVCQWSHALRSTEQQGVQSVSYSESLLCPDFKSAFVGYMSSFVLLSLAANPLTRPILRSVVPAQGEGPDQETMDKKHFLCVYGLGTGKTGHRVESYMYFPKDPGCLETARMLVESGLCLALQEDQLLSQQAGNNGGFWTPATALGDVLMQRLVKTGTLFERRVIAPR